MAKWNCTRCGRRFATSKRSDPTLYCMDCIEEMKAKAPVNPALDAQLAREKAYKEEQQRKKVVRR